MTLMFLFPRRCSPTCFNSARLLLLENRQLETCCFRMQSKTSGTMPQTPGNEIDAESTPLNANAYARLQEYPLRENLIALKKVKFRNDSRAEQQHLDVGCGPGGFTNNHLLQHCSPCLRLVAVDKSPAMIDVARQTSQHPKIYYDVLDIEAEEVDSFTSRYGRFSRVYSFLCFHFLKSQKAGFANVRRLLEDEGECFITGCLESAILNVWLDVYIRKKWRIPVPDPRERFSDMHYFHCKTSTSELQSAVRSVVAGAGLNCLDCQIYRSNWEFPNIETALNFAFMCFDFELHISVKDLPEFTLAWREGLTKLSTQTSSGCAFAFTFYTVHATR